jgi:hypothetical protein
MPRFFVFLLVIFMALPAFAEESAKTPPPPAPKVSPLADKNCLVYEPGVVTLKGKLHHGGVVWLLELDEPTCVLGRENDKAGLYPDVETLEQVELWHAPNQSGDEYLPLVDREVAVTGTLHHKTFGHTGRVMIQVSRVQTVEEKQ